MFLSPERYARFLCTKIGKNCLIADKATFSSHLVVAGNPARILCAVEEYLERNLPFNTGTKGISQAIKDVPYLNWMKKSLLKKDFLKP